MPAPAVSQRNCKESNYHVLPAYETQYASSGVRKMFWDRGRGTAKRARKSNAQLKKAKYQVYCDRTLYLALSFFNKSSILQGIANSKCRCEQEHNCPAAHDATIFQVLLSVLYSFAVEWLLYDGCMCMIARSFHCPFYTLISCMLQVLNLTAAQCTEKGLDADLIGAFWPLLSMQCLSPGLFS